MRKKLALLLSFVLLIGSTITVKAADLSPWENTGSAEVSYWVDSSYIISIPETIYLNDEYFFEASYLNIQPIEYVAVYVTNLTDGMLTVTNEYGDSDTLTIYGADVNGKVAEFTSESMTSNMSITASMNDMAKAGTYKGTIEFQVGLGLK